MVIRQNVAEAIEEWRVYDPWNPSWEATAVYRARVRGCLLGGAVGDALGYPVEFASLAVIRSTYGDRGVTGLVPDVDGAVGRVSDDTQMTLFTVEGLRQAHERARRKGIDGAWPQLVREAYGRWLDTQRQPGPDPRVTSGLAALPWLYARRAPGNACLSGLAQVHHPDPATPLGRPGPVNPDSKGCGTVMRSAPFGLARVPAGAAFDMAARCARMTHGHPTGGYAAGALAAIVAHLVADESLEGAVLRTLRLLSRHPGHEETSTALNRALDLAAEGAPTAEKVESLGQGWVAEEALAMGVYCALATHSVSEALLLAVNHSGDSDSTGSICGNLLGAHYGDHGLPHDWLAATEGRADITVLADDFATENVRK
ncbi:ADP-ribosylglycohydrolase family protein [Streptomyces sp. NPDC008159]|uniref:ADP-ribosylglycohydrolase family protein n=1 Tax=Streptomyces sp. NPDC008159 TaxID=3364817 RepID=UPI0036E46C54